MERQQWYAAGITRDGGASGLEFEPVDVGWPCGQPVRCGAQGLGESGPHPRPHRELAERRGRAPDAVDTILEHMNLGGATPREDGRLLLQARESGSGGVRDHVLRQNLAPVGHETDQGHDDERCLDEMVHRTSLRAYGLRGRSQGQDGGA